MSSYYAVMVSSCLFGPFKALATAEGYARKMESEGAKVKIIPIRRPD